MEPLQVVIIGGINAVDLQMSRTLATQVAAGVYSVISGGQNNRIDPNAQNTTIGSGANNTIAFNSISTASTIGGGQNNYIISQASTIGGGSANSISFATAEYSTIGGGNQNTIMAQNSVISGGTSNIMPTVSSYCVIPGGYLNTASGTNSFASGYNSRALNNDTFTWSASGGPTTTNNSNQVIFNLEGTSYTGLAAGASGATGGTYTGPNFPANTYFINGHLKVEGDIYKRSNNFLIDHPILENKYLRHICPESPRADLIYRGTVQLINGKGQVDIDKASNMTSGTFTSLSQNPQASLNNRTNWDLIKIENHDDISSGVFSIISKNTKSNAIIDWIVIAERKDIDVEIELDKIKF